MARDPHPFYVAPDHMLPDGTLRFTEGEAHHILRVIRLRAGDVCRVVDGNGGLYRVRLEAGADSLTGRILEARREPVPSRILELGFPILRLRARTEWLLEKTVEVGAARLIPIRWERSVKEISTALRSRWERIIQEAMKQSERLWLPDLAGVAEPYDPLVNTQLLLADRDGKDDLESLRGAERVRLLVGPEGGLTADEQARLIGAGARLWSLGPARLRAETAAVVGCHRLAGALRAAGDL